MNERNRPMTLTQEITEFPSDRVHENVFVRPLWEKSYWPSGSAATDAGQARAEKDGTNVEKSGAEQKECTGFCCTAYRSSHLLAHFSTCPQWVHHAIQVGEERRMKRNAFSNDWSG